MKEKDSSILVNGYSHIPYQQTLLSEEEMLQKSNTYYHWLDKRRSVREFSSAPISKEIIENILKAASTAPSGAHKQPWTFCAVTIKNLKLAFVLRPKKKSGKITHIV